MRSKNQDLMRKIKAYVEEYAMQHNGNAPSTTMIGDKFHMTRVSGYRYLKAMDELGMIIYRDGKVRTDKLDKINMRTGDLSENYIEGITAGTPVEIEGMVDEYFSMPPLFVDGQRGHFFTLIVKGDSMIDAGIDDGDIVICRKSEEANVDDIVVAYIRGSGSTLKRYCRDDDGLFLWAENNSWNADDRVFGREFDVQGVAIKVLKDI